MTAYVVDASVGVKWFIPEPYEKEAEKLLSDIYTLLVPDLFFVEIANIFWKRIRKEEMKEQIALKALQKLDTFALRCSSCASLSVMALEIANLTGCTAYDGLYLALAVRENTVVVSADKRLFNNLKTSSWAKYIMMIEDFLV